jgi:hypothetical protein
MFDAVCQTIDTTGKKLSEMPEADRPGLVMCVIITDGEENSSIEYKLEHVKARIKEQTEKYNWQFVFVGANIDAFNAASQFGISHGNTIQYTANSKGTSNLYGSLSKNVACYRAMSACGQSVGSKDFFDATDRDAQKKATV